MNHHIAAIFRQRSLAVFRFHLLLIWGLGLCLPRLAAQYPSASYRTSMLPMLAEPRQTEAPSYNPAFLGLGRDSLRDDLPQRFHLRILDLLISYSLFAFAIAALPSFEEEIGKRADDLAAGMSVPFTNLNSRNQIYQDILSDYLIDLQNNVIPPLVATGTAPPGLTKTEVEAEAQYIRYKNRLEGDGNILVRNLGNVIADIGISFLQDMPFFNTQAYAKIFDMEILLGSQVSFGFGLNIRTHVSLADNLAGFTVDISSLQLPSMNLDGVNLPTNADWANPVTASPVLYLALVQASTQYVQNLNKSLSAEKLEILVLQALFTQSYIGLYHVVEPNIRFSFGLPLTDWLYMGHRIQGQLLLGADNLMIPDKALNLDGDSPKLAEYIYNPLNYQLGAHVGWDVSFVFIPWDWLNVSVMLTDVLGLAPGTDNASVNYWGDPYYPFDIQFGVFFQIPIGPDFGLGMGTDVYEIVSMLGNRKQRFNLDSSQEFIDHFRAKFSFKYLGQFELALHYWDQAIGFSLGFDFLTLNPSIGIEIDLDFQDIRIRIDIIHFTK